MLRHKCEKAQGCLAARRHEKALHVTKGTTLNAKPQVRAGSRQAVRNAKLRACLSVPACACGLDGSPTNAGRRGLFTECRGRFAEGLDPRRSDRDRRPSATRTLPHPQSSNLASARPTCTSASQGSEGHMTLHSSVCASQPAATQLGE